MSAVHHLEVVLTATSGRLGQQHHITQHDPGQGQTSVAGHIGPGKLPVQGRHLVAKSLRQGLRTPFRVCRSVHQLGLTLLHEPRGCPLGIRAEHRTPALDQLRQSLRRGGQAGNIVPRRAQGCQEIVQRGHHLHPGGCQGILSRPFVVEYGYLLLAFGLALEFQVAVHCFRKFLQPLRNGLQPLQSVLILVVPEKHKRPDGPVYLRRHHALGEESPDHAHLIRLPVGNEGIDIQRREEGNVVLPEKFHSLVP